MKTITWQDLTTGQYQKLTKLGDALTQDDMLRICLGKGFKEFTPDELGEVEFKELIPPDAPGLPLFFTHNGQLYGKLKTDAMTFGEYIDMLEFGKDPVGNLTECMALVFRPVKLSLTGRLKWWATKILFKSPNPKHKVLGARLESTIDYTIEKYDAGKCIMRAKSFEALPSYLAHFTLSFFFLTSQGLLQSTLNSLSANLRGKIQGDFKE